MPKSLTMRSRRSRCPDLRAVIFYGGERRFAGGTEIEEFETLILWRRSEPGWCLAVGRYQVAPMHHRADRAAGLASFGENRPGKATFVGA